MFETQTEKQQLLRKGLVSFILAFCQIFLFVFLYQFSSEIYHKFGFESFSQIDLAWGIKLEIATYIYGAISLLCNFSAMLWFEKHKISVHFIGGTVIAVLFVEDLFHLTSWTHPYRALLIVWCALISLIFPYLIFQKEFRFK